MEAEPKVSSRLSSTSRLSTSISRRVHREARFGDFVLGSTLGEGEFGKVKLGWKKNGGEVTQAAIKLIRKDTIPAKSSREIKVFREINALKILHHPNIVRLEQVIQNDKYIGIVLEYASGGELFTHISQNRHLKEPVAARIFAQLVSGVYYLHSKGIVHRDLKLENLLLDKNKNVIITDFGFANSFRKGGNQLMSTSCGSPCYAAPELVLTDKTYDGRKVDVWSCGIILYAMLAGYLPFDDDPENPDSENIIRLYKYIKATALTFPEWFPPAPRDLLRKVLVSDPEKRVSLSAVRAHPWLAPHAAFLSVTPREWDDVYTSKLAKSGDISMGQQTHNSMQRSQSTRAQPLPEKAAAMSSRPHGHIRSSSVMPARTTGGLEALSQKPAPAVALAKPSPAETEKTPSGHSRSHSMAQPAARVDGSSIDEVSSLAILPSPTRKARLPPPQSKPRPTSFHPQMMSSQAHGSYSLEPASSFSLYSPSASRPHVEITHGSSKSGEMSRPLSSIHSPSAQALASLSGQHTKGDSPIASPELAHPTAGTKNDKTQDTIRTINPAEERVAVETLRTSPPVNEAPGPAEQREHARLREREQEVLAAEVDGFPAVPPARTHRRGNSVTNGFQRLFGNTSHVDPRRHSALPVATKPVVSSGRKRFSAFGVPGNIATIDEEQAIGLPYKSRLPAHTADLEATQEPLERLSKPTSDWAARSAVPVAKEQSAAKRMVNFFKRRSTVAS